MLKISRVDTLDNHTLDIELDNGNLILFNIKPLLEYDPAYVKLKDQALLPKPSTDGMRIFWRDGPSLTLDEIMTLITEQVVL